VPPTLRHCCGRCGSRGAEWGGPHCSSYNIFQPRLRLRLRQPGCARCALQLPRDARRCDGWAARPRLGAEQGDSAVRGLDIALCLAP